jgi:DNA-directed RNA polymerase subunit RPC12/RpoP
MYQSQLNPKFTIPDMAKYHCCKCGKDFILSDGYDNTKAKCPYCQSENIEASVAKDPDQLDALGCLAISFCRNDAGKDGGGADS